MKYLNTNSMHNLINVAITVLAQLALFDFTKLGLTPERALTVIAILGLMKLVMNAVRDGMVGMVEQQPPVTATVVLPPAVQVPTAVTVKTVGPGAG